MTAARVVVVLAAIVPLAIGLWLMSWYLAISGIVWVVELTGPWFPAAIGGLCLSQHVQLQIQREAEDKLVQSGPSARLR